MSETKKAIGITPLPMLVRRGLAFSVLPVLLVLADCSSQAPGSALRARTHGFSVRLVASDSEGFCRVLATGEVDCWGDNSSGELGNGTTGGPDGANGYDTPQVALSAL